MIGLPGLSLKDPRPGIVSILLGVSSALTVVAFHKVSTPGPFLVADILGLVALAVSDLAGLILFLVLASVDREQTRLARAKSRKPSLILKGRAMMEWEKNAAGLVKEISSSLEEKKRSYQSVMRVQALGLYLGSVQLLVTAVVGGIQTHFGWG